MHGTARMSTLRQTVPTRLHAVNEPHEVFFSACARHAVHANCGTPLLAHPHALWSAPVPCTGRRVRFCARQTSRLRVLRWHLGYSTHTDGHPAARWAPARASCGRRRMGQGPRRAGGRAGGWVGGAWRAPSGMVQRFEAVLVARIDRGTCRPARLSCALRVLHCDWRTVRPAGLHANKKLFSATTRVLHEGAA